jgi:hypothetical protein
MAENRPGVLAHTEMALRMLDDGQSLTMTDWLMADLTAYSYAKALGDMSIMDMYADAFYNSEKDYLDFTLNPYSEVKNFLSEHDPTVKFATILDAASKGDLSAKARLDNILDEATDELVMQARNLADIGATGADKVSGYANTGAIGALLLGDVPLAISLGGISFVADISGLGLSILAGNEEKRNKFYAAVALDVVFKGISKFAPNYPKWNYGTKRYIDSSTKKFITTIDGIVNDLLSPVTGIFLPQLFERKF